MAKKPWEKFKPASEEVASSDPATSAKPWEKFQATAPAEEEMSAENDTPLLSVMGGLKAGAKALDTPRAVTGGPALGGILGLLSGKDVFRGKEWVNAVNPTKYDTFPDSATMLERAGVPKGGSVSDIIPGFAEPGEGGTFTPEKGGLFDITTRGVGGFAMDALTDPLTYLSMGGSLAGKQAIKESASTLAHQSAKNPGMMKKLVDMAMVPATHSVEAMGEGANSVLKKLSESKFGEKIGRVAQAVATAPSDTMRTVGKRLYNSPLIDLEHEGEVLGKADIGESLYNAGIWNPFKLDKQVKGASNTLMQARQKIYDMADATGQTLDVENMLQGAKEEIARLRETKHPKSMDLADAMEQEIDRVRKISEGTPGMPGTPASTRQVDTGIVDAQGRPVMRSENIAAVPGTPGTPGRPYTTSEASTLKSALYQDSGDAPFDLMKNSPPGKQFTSRYGTGVKDAIEDHVADVVSPNAAVDMAELNREAGNLLATTKSQRKVAKNVDRTLNDVTSNSRLDNKIMGTQMARGEPGHGVLSIMLSKALGLANLGTMPTGYGMRKAGSGLISAPAVDFVTRKGYKNMAGYNPWEVPDGEE